MVHCIQLSGLNIVTSIHKVQQSSILTHTSRICLSMIFVHILVLKPLSEESHVIMDQTTQVVMDTPKVRSVLFRFLSCKYFRCFCMKIPKYVRFFCLYHRILFYTQSLGCFSKSLGSMDDLEFKASRFSYR